MSQDARSMGGLVVSDALLLFAAGVIVGAVVVLGAIGVRTLRRAEAASSTTGVVGAHAVVPNVLRGTSPADAAPSVAAAPIEGARTIESASGGGILGNLVERAVEHAIEGKPGTQVIRTVRKTRIQLAGPASDIVVDGTTYHGLHEVPKPLRELLVDELRAAVAQVPEGPARSRIEAFLAAGGQGLTASAPADPAPMARPAPPDESTGPTATAG
jgi:hypothetical protein